MSIDIQYRQSYLTPAMEPRGPVSPWVGTTEAAQSVVDTYLNNQWRGAARDPRSETLNHPYFVPGGHYEHLWDWDAFFMATAAWSPEMWSYSEGSLLNLIEAAGPDGRPPKLIRVDGSLDFQHPIPLHAQWMNLICSRREDWSLARDHWDTLVAIQNWYDRNTRRPDGLYFWLGMAGPGFDNHPGVYGRPDRSVAGVDLNSFHVRELLAWDRLAAGAGRTNPFARRAAELQELMQRWLYDPVDRFYYNLDLSGADCPVTNQQVTWPVHLKFRHVSGVMPLWANVPDQARAEGIIDGHLLNAEGLLSPCGIRSLSKCEPLYNNVPMANPSNWQGPVWVLSTYLAIQALRNYRRHDAAREVAARLIRTLAADIEGNGVIHEFYHGETGQPLLSPGFLSWNLLAFGLTAPGESYER
jgi:putative isomerase